MRLHSGIIHFLVEDAVAARNSAVHQANLFDMANIGTVIVKKDRVGGLDSLLMPGCSQG